MLRIACALARLISKDPNSPTTSTPVSPAPRKQSLKSKPTWRSASVHADNRTQGFKCPFTATNALTAATKKEIDAYTSSEEIRHSESKSTDRINEGKELEISTICEQIQNRRSLAIRFEDHRESKELLSSDESEEHKSPVSEPIMSSESANKINKETIPAIKRKSSCTVALDVYRRRGSGIPMRPRLNSISHINGDKLNAMKEKFGTPEKVMHFFGRCFVKFFSNYGYVLH